MTSFTKYTNAWLCAVLKADKKKLIHSKIIRHIIMLNENKHHKGMMQEKLFYALEVILDWKITSYICVMCDEVWDERIATGISSLVEHVRRVYWFLAYSVWFEFCLLVSFIISLIFEWMFRNKFIFIPKYLFLYY